MIATHWQGKSLKRLLAYDHQVTEHQTGKMMCQTCKNFISKQPYGWRHNAGHGIKSCGQVPIPVSCDRPPVRNRPKPTIKKLLAL